MGELTQIAREYFDRMEGMHLYPGWKAPQWHALLGSGVAFISLACYDLVHVRDRALTLVLAVLVAAAAAVVSAAQVARFRRVTLLGLDIKNTGAANARIDALRVAALEELFAACSCEFAFIVKDAQQLVSLTQCDVFPIERALPEIGERILSIETPVRRWTVALALTVCTGTLFIRGLPSSLEVVTLDCVAFTVAGSLLFRSVASMVGWPIRRRIIRMARLAPRYETQLALRYLIHDLSRLRPASARA